MHSIALPDESGTIAMAAALTMWSFALLGFLGALIWLRAHRMRLTRRGLRPEIRVGVQAPPRPEDRPVARPETRLEPDATQPIAMPINRPVSRPTSRWATTTAVGSARPPAARRSAPGTPTSPARSRQGSA